MTSTTRHALVYGGSGALGRALVSFFSQNAFKTTSIDFSPNPSAAENIVLPTTSESLDAQAKFVLSSLKEKASPSFDIICNAAGGWAGGNVTAPGLCGNVELMWKQSVWSSVVCAMVAAEFLKEGGLMTLVGANAATQGTSGMIAYGMAKSSVHQLSKSLADPNSGLPKDAKVACILPITLDTPMNRKYMPDSDFTTWTSCEVIAQKYHDWLSGKEAVTNGGLYKVVTKAGQTTFSLV